MSDMNCFVSAMDISIHPMLKVKPKIRIPYFRVLSAFVLQISPNDKILEQRLKVYEKNFFNCCKKIPVQKSLEDDIFAVLEKSGFRPWRRKYRFMLLLDIAFLLLDERKIIMAYEMICHHLNKKKYEKLADFKDSLLKDTSIDPAFGCPVKLFEQYCINRDFLRKVQKNYIVTANMSSGKSTLINALIGKQITRTSQEACTANIGYIYNKPFDDGTANIITDHIELYTDEKKLKNIGFDYPSFISLNWQLLCDEKVRVCFIDTPGVNNSISREHIAITRRTIKNEKYDKLIYVLDINRLGTDEEIRHLKWLADNVPIEKIIFVLNKIDNCRSSEDDIKKSIENLKCELSELGFKEAAVCPVSAYAALLAKIKKSGITLSDDDAEDYDVMKRKFNRPYYDLTAYYSDPPFTEDEEPEQRLLQKCGFYGLEKILFGGTK